jgi:RNase H-like domain found in reverse transcriptase
VVETDHKNLTYWKSPKKLTGRTARWHERLQDYNFRILHISGNMNTSADALSRPAEEEKVHEEKLLSLIPPEVFINVLNGEDPTHLVQRILDSQYTHQSWLKQ